uniref:Uncharacterized protein n=1 Tax=Haemonchus contortus TaxID=6289 RepID=A0A7I4XTN6_HAECO
MQKKLAENGTRLILKSSKLLSCGERQEPTVDDHGEAMEEVQYFLHLRIDMAADGSVDLAVKSRINAAWMRVRESSGTFCDRWCSKTVKGKVYRIVVIPTMLYGSEYWLVIEKHERQVHSVEMRMLRWAGFDWTGSGRRTPRQSCKGLLSS